MGIKVHISSLLSHYTNNQRIAEVNGGTVSECLKHLTEQFSKLKLFDKDGRLRAYFSIYVNREPMYSRSLSGDPKKLDTPVKDGDEIAIILMVGGG